MLLDIAIFTAIIHGCLFVRIPFESPECDTYEENKRELINYGLKLLHLSQDSSLVSESANQEAMLSLVSAVTVYSYSY